MQSCLLSHEKAQSHYNIMISHCVGHQQRFNVCIHMTYHSDKKATKEKVLSATPHLPLHPTFVWPLVQPWVSKFLNVPILREPLIASNLDQNSQMKCFLVSTFFINAQIYLILCVWRMYEVAKVSQMCFVWPHLATYLAPSNLKSWPNFTNLVFWNI